MDALLLNCTVILKEHAVCSYRTFPSEMLPYFRGDACMLSSGAGPSISVCVLYLPEQKSDSLGVWFCSFQSG